MMLLKCITKVNADFHQMVADMANIPRKQAKTVNLGLCMVWVKVTCKCYGYSRRRGRKIIRKYNEKVPFLRSLSDKAMNRACKDSGVIRTWLGRKCRFDMYEPMSYGYNKALPMEEAIDEYGGKGRIRRAFTYKALNRLIQGSSADQTKESYG